MKPTIKAELVRMISEPRHTISYTMYTISHNVNVKYVMIRFDLINQHTVKATLNV